jgi:hypothetical protein
VYSIIAAQSGYLATNIPQTRHLSLGPGVTALLAKAGSVRVSSRQNMVLLIIFIMGLSPRQECILDLDR